MLRGADSESRGSSLPTSFPLFPPSPFPFSSFPSPSSFLSAYLPPSLSFTPIFPSFLSPSFPPPLPPSLLPFPFPLSFLPFPSPPSFLLLSLLSSLSPPFPPTLSLPLFLSLSSFLPSFFFHILSPSPPILPHPPPPSDPPFLQFALWAEADPRPPPDGASRSPPRGAEQRRRTRWWSQELVQDHRECCDLQGPFQSIPVRPNPFCGSKDLSNPPQRILWFCCL